MTNSFPGLNFNPILFNLIRTFPTFFKTQRRLSPIFLKLFLKVWPDHICYLKPAKYIKERYFCGKYFHKFGYLKSRILRKIFLNLSESQNFEFIWIAKLSSAKLTLHQVPNITHLVSKYSLLVVYLGIFLQMDCLNLISRKIFLQIYPK